MALSALTSKLSDSFAFLHEDPSPSEARPLLPPANSSRMSSPIQIPQKEASTFTKLVRSLSRSRPSRGGRPSNRTRSSSTGVVDGGKYTPTEDSEGPLASPGAALATSPPPDSYFPRPPSAVLNDDEATGIARHPDSVGARALDVGDDSNGKAAPGVSFAPSTNGARKTDSELEGWAPAPRRTHSQRVKRQPSGSGGLSRTRSSRQGKENDGSAAFANGKVQVGDRVVDAGERNGVQLEDKPLTRRTTLSRAASSYAKRMQKAFDPLPKAAGEKRMLILVADGSEEIETLTALDLFVRGGLSPVLVSLSPPFSPSHSLMHITLSRGAKLLADTQFETLRDEHKEDFDAVFIPGGAKGAERLSQDSNVQRLLWQFYEAGKLVGCICAGSLAAKTAGIGLGGRITSHPSVKGDLEKHYEYTEERVCIDGNLVTSRGPGTAIEHALAIIEILQGKKKRDEVADALCL
ncbi:hypothetical protein JCM10213_004531 [Rhodosporidiobolus nylandii]